MQAGTAPISIGLLKRLYQEERMTLEEIGKRFGVTKQAVHLRLQKAGVPMRRRGKRMKPTTFELLRRKVNTDKLVKKHLNGWSVARISREFGLGYGFVRWVMAEEGIEVGHKAYNRRFPELYTLKPGDSVVVTFDRPNQPSSRLHDYAKKAGIRVSVKKLGADKFEMRRL